MARKPDPTGASGPCLEARINDTRRVLLPAGYVYRWAQVWPQVCADLALAPVVLAVGDLHVTNFEVGGRVLQSNIGKKNGVILRF